MSVSLVKIKSHCCPIFRQNYALFLEDKKKHYYVPICCFIWLFFLFSDATLHPIHRSMGVSRSASICDRSSVGALKASLTPSNNPYNCVDVVVLVVVDENALSLYLLAILTPEKDKLMSGSIAKQEREICCLMILIQQKRI